MIRALPLALLLAAPAAAQRGDSEQQRWTMAATASSIIRDDWGIAHVHGRSDADAVFAMIYAQAEDDFPRIERNYLVALGRLAEAEGETALWQDLRQRLFLDDRDQAVPHQLQANGRKRIVEAHGYTLSIRMAPIGLMRAAKPFGTMVVVSSSAITAGPGIRLPIVRSAR